MSYLSVEPRAEWFGGWRFFLACIVALVLTVIAGAMAVAMGLACKQVVFEVNDEVSYAVVELGRGAYLIPAGGVGALVAAVALLIAHIRDSHR